MSKIVKAMAKQKQLSGKFQVEERDPSLDNYAKVRGAKSRICFDLAQDIKLLGATKVIVLSTDEEFVKTWGAVRPNMQYIRNTLRHFGIQHPVVVQHEGKIKIWAK